LTPPTPRSPNFDTLRLLAALAVVVSHSLPLTYGPAATGMLWSVSHHQTTLADTALDVFFIISGYLVTSSYVARPDPVRFLRARFLRIVPALVPILFTLAFVLGPLLTALPLAAYFSSPLPYRAAVGLARHLPGVFANNPYSPSIDGSLACLPYFAVCYAGVLILGLAGGLNRLVLTPLYILDLTAFFQLGSPPLSFLTSLFLAGAVIAAWSPPIGFGFAAPAAFLWALSLFFHGYPLITATCGAYVVVYLGRAEFRLPDLAKYGDLSYGVFIVAWPIQQTVVALAGAHANWLVSNLVTIPLALGFAWASWQLIESRALRLKEKQPFSLP
jgi:peptidoglycan/LPS O-acetylase OafA/YrhL